MDCHSVEAAAGGAQAEPIIIPTRKTRKPPRITWKAAERKGVSMKWWRIQEMTPSSTATTATATPVAMRKSPIRYGSVCPIRRALS